MMQVFPIRLLCYCTLSLALSLLLSWSGPFTLRPTPQQLHSVAIIAPALLASLLNFRFFSQFPGDRSAMSILSIAGAWFAMGMGGLLFFRIEYSLYCLAVGLACIVACLSFEFFYMKRRKSAMAFVPIGRVGSDLLQHKNIEWIQLDRPELPAATMDAIVADLHSPQLGDAWQKFLADCALAGIQVFNIRQIEESLTGRVKTHHMYENILGSLQPSKAYMHVKGFIDIVLVLLAIPLCLPFMLLTAVAIKLDDRGRVFYAQPRVGLRNKSFTAYKFRSMREGASTQTTAQDDDRITRVGRIIRKTRIDELPQFLNVLKGEMSLIGPRAEYKAFAEELEKQLPFYKYRHIVKPGISGWAQVMHGYATGAEETRVKLEYDFYYIKNFSFSLDVLIFFKTIKTMLTGFGAR